MVGFLYRGMSVDAPDGMNSANRGTWVHTTTFTIEAVLSHPPHRTRHMNIYIIGVVVVIGVIAGFFGLHV